MKYLLFLILLLVSPVRAEDFEVTMSSDVCLSIHGDYVFNDFEFNTETKKLKINYGKCEEIGLKHVYIQYHDFLCSKVSKLGVYAEICQNCKLIRERKDTEWIYLEEDKE